MRKNYFLMALALMFIGSIGNAKVNGADGNAEARDAVEAVDLGLSVKWANMNVGATKDSGFGSYFAWGETKPKNYYSWDNYAWSQGNTKFLLKYTNTDRRAQLVPSDDAARANWGGEWRMPTVDEFDELTNPDNCDWEWITKDGVNGYKVTGKKTGNSIFLPITGFRFYDGVQFRAFKGIYWTSTLYTDNPNKAWFLEFDFEKNDVTFGKLSSNRFSGRCIRAVR
ncbi:MAG: hypothetical protein IKX69_07245 [Prevotella sp.]|nr:hypothetical protein [Prevotella sp.]